MSVIYETFKKYDKPWYKKYRNIDIESYMRMYSKGVEYVNIDIIKGEEG